VGASESLAAPSAPTLPALPRDLKSLWTAARSLALPTARPAFLGTGAFGGPWSNRSE
jgi:hypothetical protein